MAPRKVSVADGQVGFSDDYTDFEVPVVALPKAKKQADPISALDLEKRPQTWLKLLSLEQYLPVWFGKICNVSDSAYYIDFFAGPGRYAKGLLSVEGSPILACRAAMEMVEWHRRRGHTKTPHLRFVEPDPATRASLESELTQFDGVLDYRVLPTNAAAVVDDLLAESAGTPTLAFFDPFGYDIDFSWVSAFARPGVNEVLISFDAQSLKRNIAAGQTSGVTEFSGGSWWQAHVTGTDLNLDSFLRELALRHRQSFRYAGVQQFEYLSNHALRAVVQCCGSVKGREAWLRAVAKSRSRMQVVDDFFPELDEAARVNQVIDRLRGMAGQRVIYKEIIAQLDDLEWSDAIGQALAFLNVQGLLSWADRTSTEGRDYTLFWFSRSWPAGLAWDGVQRPGLARAKRSPAPSVR